MSVRPDTRAAVFCRDGVLRARVGGNLFPISDLADPGSGLPWWLPSLSVEMETGVTVAGAVRCLLPWEDSLARDLGVDLRGWLPVRAARPDSGGLRVLLARGLSEGSAAAWHAIVAGRESDHGTPEETPGDLLAAAEISIVVTVPVFAEQPGQPSAAMPPHPNLAEFVGDILVGRLLRADRRSDYGAGKHSIPAIGS